MITSRQYRRQTSFATVLGHTFRITDEFVSHLLLTISYAENQPPSDVQYLRTASGTATPMTLSELYQLRDAIINQQRAALQAQVS
jgi:hypothetical protein